MFYKQDVMIQSHAVLFKYQNIKIECKKKLSVTGMVDGWKEPNYLITEVSHRG